MTPPRRNGSVMLSATHCGVKQRGYVESAANMDAFASFCAPNAYKMVETIRLDYFARMARQVSEPRHQASNEDASYILNMQSLVFACELPSSFWENAADDATYIMNRSTFETYVETLLDEQNAQLRRTHLLDIDETMEVTGNLEVEKLQSQS